MEEKIRFLEMIQNIITRMAGNCFALKGWAVTLAAGIFALSEKDSNFCFYLIAYVPIILFWFLDSYYLQLERKYRVLYDIITETKTQDIDYKLKIQKGNKDNNTLYWQCFTSPVEIGFYFPTAILIAIVTKLSLIYK